MSPAVVYQSCAVLEQLLGLHEKTVKLLPPGLVYPDSPNTNESFAPRKPVLRFPTARVRIGDGDEFTAVFGTPYSAHGDEPSLGTVVKTVELFRASPAGCAVTGNVASVTGAHVPLLQVPPRQLWPQAPQLLLSVNRFAQAFGHTVFPPVQAVQLELTHAAPETHWLLLLQLITQELAPQTN